MREEGVKSPIWKEVRQLVDEREVISRMKVIFILFRAWACKKWIKDKKI
jgi:hypothetical protein